MENESNVTENDIKTNQNVSSSIENELKDHLNRVEGGIDEQIKKDNPDIENIKPIVISPRILDYLENKPISFLDYLFLEFKQATPTEREEIQKLFPISESNKKLSRAIIEKIIVDFVRKNPELAHYFSDENFFFIELLGRYWEMNGCLNIIREREKEKIKSI